MDRFTWGDDVISANLTPEGARHIVANPDFETSPAQRYRLAVIARIRELLASTHRGNRPSPDTARSEPR